MRPCPSGVPLDVRLAGSCSQVKLDRPVKQSCPCLSAPLDLDKAEIRYRRGLGERFLDNSIHDAESRSNDPLPRTTVASEDIVLHGNAALARSIGRWLLLSLIAEEAVRQRPQTG